MSFNLKSIIFTLFGRDAKLRDSNKNLAGKGTLERYNEALAEDFDEQITPFLNNLIDNTLVPDTALVKFLPYLENMIGDPVKLSNDVPTRRKLIRFATKHYKIRGTIPSYKLLLGMLGLEVVITEFGNAGGFDSPVTFDDPGRVFDGGGDCKTCSEYSLALTGTVPLTPELFRAIKAVIEFTEPINADLRSLTYNGSLLNDSGAIIFVDQDGDLQFENLSNTPIDFEVNEDGDLEGSGAEEQKYYIDEKGDLIYNL